MSEEQKQESEPVPAPKVMELEQKIKALQHELEGNKSYVDSYKKKLVQEIVAKSKYTPEELADTDVKNLKIINEAISKTEKSVIGNDEIEVKQFDPTAPPGPVKQSRWEERISEYKKRIYG